MRYTVREIGGKWFVWDNDRQAAIGKAHEQKKAAESVAEETNEWMRKK